MRWFLYGFIYNNKKYYYIKNIFNTILGIVDSTGNNVVKKIITMREGDFISIEKVIGIKINDVTSIYVVLVFLNIIKYVKKDIYKLKFQ